MPLFSSPEPPTRRWKGWVAFLGLAAAFGMASLSIWPGDDGRGGAAVTPPPMPADCPEQPNVSLQVTLNARGRAGAPVVAVPGHGATYATRAQRAITINLTPTEAAWKVRDGSDLRLCRVSVTLNPNQRGAAQETLYPDFSRGSFPAPDDWKLWHIEVVAQLD
ncbi:MAG TPA: hypothetical protein VMT30_06085 [Candidatus Saccharimonadia bacterium]|nr:hypothetical protein [Candidatus Saccharimonadia bacterium]